MKLRNRLRSPASLVVQGFAAGAFVFFALHPLRPSADSQPTPTGGVAIVAAGEA